MPDRPYIFHDLTIALCNVCLKRIEAKVVEQDGRVYLHKRCPGHGFQKVLVSTDADYWRLCRQTLKPGQMPLKFNTPINYGCPYDCGLCPDHEQHSCLTLLEITDACNLNCPVCYSESGTHRAGQHRSMDQIRFMLDRIVENEGEPDVVQISGGEPTIHPQFWQILDEAKSRPIKHLMLNTNGVKIASEPGFAERLAGYQPGFEVYLQWDSLKPEALKDLRGEDLRHVRLKALEQLNKHNVSTTLVVTLKKGVNDDEVGSIIDFALTQGCVRGVTFQPVQVAGRLEHFDPAKDRLTLAEVRQNILTQTNVFQPNDVIPVPCHPDCLAMAYALKVDGQVIPLTGLIDPKVLLHGEGSTIVYEKSDIMRGELFKLFSTAASPESSEKNLAQLLCCLPQVCVPGGMSYNNIFRVIIMKFMDGHDLDVRSVKKTCVHIAHPDGRIIPFDPYNLFYRDDKVKVLEEVAGRGNGVSLPVLGGGGL
ncbi:MAG: radical SAM protein [Tepidisphaeraceae bacterium]